MLDALLAIFGCPHKSETFPLTIRNRKTGVAGQTYVVCLRCGQETPYDWQNMRRGEPKGAESAAVPQEDAG